MRYLLLFLLVGCATQPAPGTDLPRNGTYYPPYQWVQFCEEHPADPACADE